MCRALMVCGTVGGTASSRPAAALPARGPPALGRPARESSARGRSAMGLDLLRGPERFQGLAGQPEGGPFLHRVGPQLLVEVDGRLVPVQDAPLDAGVAAVDRGRG